MTNYRLLRNNKETGPYTAEQLIKLGLKPYDLVWREGKSAAWNYPGEMEEFKAFAPLVEEQPFDRFFKKEGLQKQDIIHSACNVTAETAAPAVKVKPRIRIKADWNKVGATAAAQVIEPPQVNKLPVKEEQAPAITNAPAQASPVQKPLQQAQKKASPTWESSWLDWKQEKTAVQHADKTAGDNEAATTMAAKTAPGYEPPVLETKFTQSLTDIKEKYAATVLKAKSKAVEWHRFKNIAILALLAIPVLGIGMWAGNTLGGKTASEKAATVKSVIPNAQVAVVQPAEAADNTAKDAPAAEVQKPAVKSTPKEVIPSFDDEAAKQPAKQANTKVNDLGKTHFVPVNPKAVPVKAAIIKSQPVVKNNKPVQAAAKQPQPPVQPQRYVFTNPGNTSQGRAKTINPALLNNQPVVQTPVRPGSRQQPVTRQNEANNSPIFSHVSKNERIEDYVSIEADETTSPSVQNLRLNVENVADFRLDLVVIDVEYFNANGRFKAGQTMYVKNLPSGETMNVKIPDNAAATRIKYKVSLVSAEQKGVYLIGE